MTTTDPHRNTATTRACQKPMQLDPTGALIHQQTDALRFGPDATPVALRDGVTAWAVTDAQVAKALLTDPNITRDAARHWRGFDFRTQPPWMTAWTSPSMFNASGTDHTRLRKLISPAFTTRRVQALRPAITAIVKERLDHISTIAPGTVFDLRETFAFKIPVAVICDLVGVPRSDRDHTAQLMESALDTSVDAAQAANNAAAMTEAIAELIAYKRRQPGDDMTTQLLDIHADGDHLNDDELLATVLLMIGAGSETTVALIDNTAVALLTHPNQLAKVLADPRRWTDAIEESLRRDGPAAFLPMRYAISDHTLPDRTHIPAGDPIIICFNAHGRDPAANPDPHTWNLDRVDRSHLAFGHGIHHCLGAPLARLEANIALQFLFTRHRLELAVATDQLTPRPSFIGNDYSAIPVRRLA